MKRIKAAITAMSVILSMLSGCSEGNVSDEDISGSVTGEAAASQSNEADTSQSIDDREVTTARVSCVYTSSIFFIELFQ